MENKNLNDIERSLTVISSESNERIQSSEALKIPYSSGEKIRAQTNLFRYKLKVYCALHRPVGWTKYYHLLVINLIIMSCIVFNVLEDYFQDWSLLCMTIIDSFLIIILLLESILRFWSSDCIYEYQGFEGKLYYYRSYGVMRAIDLIGILTFLAFVIIQDFDELLGISLRLLHLIQIFQLHRIISDYLKIIISTIYDQFDQLYIAIIFSTLIMILISFGIHTLEMKENNGINDIFDGIWFGFITLSTIGYGDTVPTTGPGRIFTAALAIFGICMLTLPSNIFGTGLALKLREQQKTVLQRNPAAKLIEIVWKIYASHPCSQSKATWDGLHREDNESLNENDRTCIRFIRLLRYRIARNEFKLALNPQNIEDDVSVQLDLLRRIEYIEKNVNELKFKAYEAIYQLKDIHESLNTVYSKLNETQ